MQSNAARALVALAAVAIIAIGFVALSDDESGDQPASATTTETTTEAGPDPGGPGDAESKSPPRERLDVPTIEVVNGRPVGGVADLTFSKGDEIRFVVDSDTADEVHVHGYEVMEDVTTGGGVTFNFAAGIEGIFEVELEGSATQIAELTVNP